MGYGFNVTGSQEPNYEYGVDAAQKSAGISAAGQSTQEQYMLYMNMIYELYNKQEPYTEEDYQKLMVAMKGLETLNQQDPPPDDMTSEMRYNIQTTLYLLGQAGISTSGTLTAEEQLTAMNTWANQSITILSWTDASEITSDQFMQGVTSLTGVEHGTWWLIELAFADTSDEYATQLALLGEAMQLTNELLAELEALYAIINHVEVGDIPAWELPPVDANGFPPPGSDLFKELEKILADLDYQPDDPYVIYDPVTDTYITLDYKSDDWGKGKDKGDAMYPDDALRYYLKIDYERAEQMVEDNPGMTMEEALSQQTLAAQVLQAYLPAIAEEDPQALQSISDILMQHHFEYNNSSLSVELLEELYVELEETMNDLENILDQLDPTGELRTQSDSLPYYIDQILKEYEEICAAYPDSPSQIMMHFLEVTSGQAESGSSGDMLMFYLNQAITTSQSLTGEQQVDLEAMMKLFQAIYTALAETQKAITKAMTTPTTHYGG